MKKWLIPIAVLATVGVLSRLPHPARDISKLDPVQTVYIYIEGNAYHMETDTGDSGTGTTLAAAAEDMKSKADAELFLETAEYLLLSPDLPIAQELFTLFRPSAHVVFTESKPDLSNAAPYLAIHTPELTLAALRTIQPNPYHLTP